MEEGSSHDQIGGLERPAKRKRIALACTSCRDRKVRCDGQKPVCGPCQRRGNADVDCAYAMAGSAKQQSEQEYIICLQQEIRSMRQALGNRQNRESESSTSYSGSPITAAVVASVPLRAPQPAVQPDARRKTATVNKSAQPRLTPLRIVESANSSVEPSPVSAMGAAISIASNSSLPRRGELYGQSSIVSLQEEVTRPIRRRSSHSDVSSATPTSNGSMLGRNSGDADSHYLWHRPLAQDTQGNSLPEAPFTLPPSDTANELLDLYFSNVHIFYPWTHAISVRRQYERIWPGQSNQPDDTAPCFDVGLGSTSCPRRVFWLALNAMFALGLQFSKFDAAAKEDASQIFQRRIEDLINMELLGGNSLAHVQAFLLVSQYLFCTQYPSRCWNMSGLACRMAVALGIQFPSSSKGLLDIEVEVRRRVWYGCVQMDLFISMTLGRKPSMSMDQAVPMPRPIDDKVLEASGSPQLSGLNSPSINAFMVENISLTLILGNILEALYEPGSRGQKDQLPHLVSRSQSKGRGSEDFSTIAYLDNHLENISRELPEFLQPRERITAVEPRDFAFIRQTNVLHARILHLRLLLYRPSLSAYCDGLSPRNQPVIADQVSSTPQPASTFLSSMRLPCAISCVKIACDLIGLMEQAIREEATGAWWFSLYYLITCGMILLLAQSTRDLETQLIGQDLERNWDTCIQTLKNISRRIVGVDDYIQTLIALKERAAKRKPGSSQALGCQMPVYAPGQDINLSIKTPRYQANNVCAYEQGNRDANTDAHLRWEWYINSSMPPDGFQFGSNPFIDPIFYEQAIMPLL